MRHFGKEKIPKENPFYTVKGRRETLEDLENVWLKKIFKGSKEYHRSTVFKSIDIKKHKRVLLLNEISNPKKRSYPNIHFLKYEEKKSFSNLFHEIQEEIENSREILGFEEGWDGIDAPKIPVEIYNEAIDFLKRYVNFIYNKMGIIIDAPEINAGINKNVFISWRTKNARLAISFEYNNDGDIIAHYYGDLNEDKEPIKGNIPTNDVKYHLVYWMKNLI